MIVAGRLEAPVGRGQKLGQWQGDDAVRRPIVRCVLELVAREQHAYLLGVDHDLKAMTRAWLAQQLGVHESTISRAVADKHITLPTGQLVSLDHFFDNSFAARRALKAIIAAEARPLTDDELARELAHQGHVVAQRTVAKYRDIEHIPAVSERAKTQRLSVSTASTLANASSG